MNAPNPRSLPENLQIMVDIISKLGGTAHIDAITDALLTAGKPTTRNNAYQRLHRLELQGALARIRPGVYCLPERKPPVVSVKDFVYAEVKRQWPGGSSQHALVKAFVKQNFYAVLPETIERATRRLAEENKIFNHNGAWFCRHRPEI